MGLFSGLKKNLKKAGLGSLTKISLNKPTTWAKAAKTVGQAYATSGASIASGAIAAQTKGAAKKKAAGPSATPLVANSAAALTATPQPTGVLSGLVPSGISPVVIGVAAVGALLLLRK